MNSPDANTTTAVSIPSPVRINSPDANNTTAVSIPSPPTPPEAPQVAETLETRTLNVSPPVPDVATRSPETESVYHDLDNDTDAGRAPDTVNEKKEWDFRLPQLPEEDVVVTHHSEPPQNMTEEAPTFDLKGLCAAVQQGSNLPSIQRYLQEFDNSVVKKAINDTVEGIPSIFYAVESNDPAMLLLWSSYGADISVIHPTIGMPLLAYAIVLTEQIEGASTADMVATLLSLGASPESIPDPFYRDYNRDLHEDKLLEDESIDSVEKWQWCSAAYVRSMMARTTHLLQRYYLERATKLKRPGARHRQIAALRHATACLGIPYFLIGQTIAAYHLLRKLMTNITLSRKKPLVLVFAGPSGHGKTELARKLGYLMGLGLQVVDCTIFNEERELFGPRAPYVGSERGSPLNNFIAQNARRRSIVFLDEFEKTSRNIHQALLLPFDNGEYQDRRTLMNVNCSRTIWILATNALDETILKFCDEHPAILHSDGNDATAKRLSRKLSTALRGAFLDRFGAPLTGRVSDFIPFLTFSKGEQAVVTHKFLLELAADVAPPILPVQLREDVEDPLLGNIRLRVQNDASVCGRLAADEYKEELGARSLRKAVEEVQDRLVETYLEEETEIVETTGVSKAEFIVDVRANEVVVRKGVEKEKEEEEEETE